VLALLGPSGCGKTTTLRVVAGLDPDYEGSVVLPASSRGAEPAVSFVFQEPRLLPWRTVRENVAIVLPKSLRDGGRVEEILRGVGLDGAGDLFPGELSGGMQRRVALARAFVAEPDLLLLDEPFVSLDEESVGQLRALLAGMLARRRITTLLVTHDLREAAELADRILVLSGPPARVTQTLSVPSVRGQRPQEMIEAFRRRLIGERGA
jgi:ABC-type nitrate/sulfonate/bicarbonate transport system ATPase subunit